MFQEYGCGGLSCSGLCHLRRFMEHWTIWRRSKTYLSTKTGATWFVFRNFLPHLLANVKEKLYLCGRKQVIPNNFLWKKSKRTHNKHTVLQTFRCLKDWKPCGSAPPCTSATSARKACTTSSMKPLTTPSTKRWPAIAHTLK